MADSSPTAGPNSAPETPEDSKTFGYDVASQSSTVSEPVPSPHSPLAAGWFMTEKESYIYELMN